MNEKYLAIIEFIVVLVLMTCAMVFKFLPEYKNNLGSSETFINADEYKELVEIKINNTPDLALVINEEDKVSDLFFLDRNACLLSNKNIEGKTINKTVKEIINLLIENNYLKENDIITLTKYGTSDYEKVKKAIEKHLKKLKITITYNEQESTIVDLSTRLEIDTTQEEKEIIKEIDLYSKNLVRHEKNDVTKNNNDTKTTTVLNETMAKEYCNNIYKSIEKYKDNNSIKNQDKSNQTMPIYLIPADTNASYFSTTNSWYYIKDSKVYAYIELTNEYKYCFQGSIDYYKKGEC